MEEVHAEGREGGVTPDPVSLTACPQFSVRRALGGCPAPTADECA